LDVSSLGFGPNSTPAAVAVAGGFSAEPLHKSTGASPWTFEVVTTFPKSKIIVVPGSFREGIKP
jgi:hypothetical protein